MEERRERNQRSWSLNRVTGPSLDKQKHWYVLSRELCGYKPTVFARNEVFASFPSEISYVDPRELRCASVGCKINRQPKQVYVVSSFGLVCALLRQREYPQDGFIKSTEFTNVISSLNSVKLEFGAKFEIGDFGAQFESDSKELRVQLENSRAAISKLEEDVRQLEAKLNREISFKSSPNSSDSAIGLSIDEINDSLLGPIVKKRKMNSLCKRVVSDLKDLSDKYRESLGCVLGNHFVFGNNEEKDETRDIISEILDVVLESSKTQKPLCDVLHPETYGKILQSMRVPDWVLLYFKIQAKLPDNSWQILLNLTQLGRGGVCNYLKM